MAIGGLVAGTTVGLMLAATPVTTIQLLANESSLSAAVTSTARLTPRLHWTDDFEYGSITPFRLTAQSRPTAALTANIAGIPQDKLADASVASTTPALANPEALDRETAFASSTLARTYSIGSAIWAPSTRGSWHSTQSSRPPTAGGGLLLATSASSPPAETLFTSHAEWDATRSSQSAVYTDASFSLASRDEKDLARFSRLNNPIASAATQPHTNVPTPGTLALFGLGLAAIMAGVRSAGAAGARLR